MQNLYVESAERRLVEPARKLRYGLEYPRGARLLKFLDREAASQNRQGGDAGLAGSVHVPRSVADHHCASRRAVHALKRGVDEVGRRLGRLDVGRSGPRIRQFATVEEVEIVLDLGLLRRARKDDRVTSAAQACRSSASMRSAE